MLSILLIQDPRASLDTQQICLTEPRSGEKISTTKITQNLTEG